MLWTWEELQALGVSSEQAPERVDGVSIDSRSVQQGDLFIALSGDPGPRFKTDIDNPRDGHDFIPSALSNGAAAVLVSNREAAATSPFIQVDNTLDGLWALGAVARRRTGGKVIGITGSAGKTTARSWLMQCLSAFQVHGSEGSLNNHWGVPLSLSKMPKESQFGVFEIGTNHPGEIAPLSQLVQPDVAVLLNVLPAHIGNFDSIDALKAEKLSMIEGLKPNGKFVLPLELSGGDSREVTFGLSHQADVSGEYEIVDGEWRVTASVAGESIQYALGTGGEHLVLTSLAILATLHCLEVDLHQTIQNLSAASMPEGRGNVVSVNGITVVNDSYNANPVSMNYALDALTKRTGKKVAILGEMKELGADSAHYHQGIANEFSKFDHVITVGEGFEACQGTEHFKSCSDIDLNELVGALSPGDTVLVKGSNKVFWVYGFVNSLVAALS